MLLLCDVIVLTFLSIWSKEHDAKYLQCAMADKIGSYSIVRMFNGSIPGILSISITLLCNSARSLKSETSIK